MRRYGGILALAVGAALFTIGSSAAQLGESKDAHILEEATWTGKNGKSVRGVYMMDEGDLIHIVNQSSGRQYKLSRANLSAETLEWFDRAKAKEFAPKKDTPPAAGAGREDGFVPLDASKLDRSAIPSLAQSEYGHKASDCLPNAYAMFFVWWDRAGVLEIPKGRDDEEKAHWIHEELARKFATRNNSGTYHDEVRKGMADYFGRRHEGRAKFAISMDYDCDPANLAALTVGAYATVLSVTLYDGRRELGGHAVSLLEADPEGNLVFNTWGETFRGKMEPLEPEDKVVWGNPHTKRFEIILAPDTKLPAWMKRAKRRFLLEPHNYDGISVLKVITLPAEDGAK